MENRITEILKPPQQPPHHSASMADWAHAESRIRTTLPSDYKHFINQYGAGSIDNFLIVLSPFCKKKALNLLTEIPGWLGALRKLKDDFGEQIPFAIFPEPNGVLPWAYTDNGDVIYWITKGEPDSWCVCANETRSPDWEQYPCNMTQFLIDSLTRRIRPSFLPTAVFQLDTYIYNSVE